MIIGISGKIGSGKDTVAGMIRSLIYQDMRLEQGFSSIQFQPPYEDFRLNSTGWEIRRFADKLKDIACLLIGCTREQLEDREFKERPLGKQWDKWLVFGANGHFQKYYSSESDALIRFNEFGPGNAEIKEVIMTPRLLLQLLGTECGREIIHPNIWVNALFADYVSEDRGLIAGKNYSESKWLIPDVRFPNEVRGIDERKGFTIRIFRDTVTPAIQHESETALDNYNNFKYTINNDGSLEDLLYQVKDILQFERIISGGRLVQS